MHKYSYIQQDRKISVDILYCEVFIDILLIDRDDKSSSATSSSDSC